MSSMHRRQEEGASSRAKEHGGRPSVPRSRSTPHMVIVGREVETRARDSSSLAVIWLHIMANCVACCLRNLRCLLRTGSQRRCQSCAGPAEDNLHSLDDSRASYSLVSVSNPDYQEDKDLIV